MIIRLTEVCVREAIRALEVAGVPSYTYNDPGVTVWFGYSQCDVLTAFASPDVIVNPNFVDATPQEKAVRRAAVRHLCPGEADLARKSGFVG